MATRKFVDAAVVVSRDITREDNPNPKGCSVLFVYCCVRSDTTDRVYIGPLLDTIRDFVKDLRLVGFPAAIICRASGRNQVELASRIRDSVDTCHLDNLDLTELREAAKTLESLTTDGNGRVHLEDIKNCLGDWLERKQS